MPLIEKLTEFWFVNYLFLVELSCNQYVPRVLYNLRRFVTGTEQLKKHENRMGYLKMSIALNLGENCGEVDDALHPRVTSLDPIVTLSVAAQDFVNELGH